MFADMSTQIAPDDMIDRHSLRRSGSRLLPATCAKFIRIEMHVDDPYTCPIGHVWWEQTWTETTQATYLLIFKGKEQITHHSKRVEGAAISKELVAYRARYQIGLTQAGRSGVT